MRKYILNPVVAAVGLIILDQATKHAVRAHFTLGESLSLAPFLQFTYLRNTGVAFSMFQGGNTIFAAITALVLIAICIWYARVRHTLPLVMRVSLLLIVAGAAGNLIDRVMLGYVTDFIDVFAGSYHWPAFNVADSCISVGGVLLFFASFRQDCACPHAQGTGTQPEHH